MSYSCGIVGLPNVGKSSLFNAFAKYKKALSENYAFCTIEPNIIETTIYEEDLEKLSMYSKSKKTIYSLLKIVDIAGLVEGASKEVGLGNRFLSHIEGVQVIIHVVRCFLGDHVSHVRQEINPIKDLEIIENELLLRDLSVLETMKKKSTKDQLLHISDVEKALLNKTKIETHIPLLSLKPKMIICNGDKDILEEKILIDQVKKKYNCSIFDFPINFYEEMSCLGENNLNHVIYEGYSLLGLISFYTTGPEETRAWSIKKGTNVKDSAEKIHSQIAKRFICADVLSCQEYMSGKSPIMVGKDYIVHNKDVIYFKHNA